MAEPQSLLDEVRAEYGHDAYDAARPVRSAFRNGGRRLVLAIAFMLGASVVAVALAVVAWLTPPPFDPFDDYPIQQVDAPLEPHSVSLAAGSSQTIAYPTISLADTRFVEVSGEKCLDPDLDQPVPVRGELRWQSVTPRGGTIFQKSGQDTDPGRLPGCTAFEYTNPIPDEVIEWAEAVFAQQQFDGQEPVVVVNINGWEQPLDADLQPDGVVQNWSTVNFALVP